MLWWTLRRIKSRNPDTRRRAAEKLGRSNDADGIQALVIALGDSDEDVRSAVKRALVTPEAVMPLLAQVKLGDPVVKKSAAEVLGRIGDQRAVEPLAEMLEGGNQSEIMAAAEALSRIGGARAVQPLGKALRLLREKDWPRRKAVVEALGKGGDSSALEFLAEVLKDGNRNEAMAAVMALRNIGDSRAIEPLVRSIRDRKLDVSKAAAAALVFFGKAAVRPLAALLRGKDEYARTTAANILGQIGDVHALEVLVVTLKDESRYVRLAVAEALGMIQDVRAAEALITVLSDKYSDVRDVAAAALEKLRKVAVNPLISALKNVDVSEGAAEVLVKIGQPATLQLVEALREDDDQVMGTAARVLLRIGEPALKHLEDALKDASQEMRTRVEWAIREINRALEEQDAATAQIRAAQTVPHLIRALDAQKYHEQKAATEALERLGSIAAPYLISTLRSGTWRQRVWAVDILGNLRDPQAVNPIAALLKDEAAVDFSAYSFPEKAVLTLEKIATDPAVDALIRILRDNKWGLAAAAAEALGKIGRLDAVEAVPSALRKRIQHFMGEASQPADALSMLQYGPLFAPFVETLVRLGQPAVGRFTEAVDDERVLVLVLAASARLLSSGHNWYEGTSPQFVHALRQRYKKMRRLGHSIHERALNHPTYTPPGHSIMGWARGDINSD